MEIRKIISKKERERKGRRNQFIIGGILILVMIMSSIGYSFNRENNTSIKKTYNGFEFIKEADGSGWETGIGDFLFFFKYNPEETGENSYELKKLDNYYDKPLYIYSNNNQAEIEIYRNLYQNQIVQRMQYACPEGDKCEGDYPIKNCGDNFIIIKEDNNSEIRQQENCVFIQGKSEDLLHNDKIRHAYLGE